ncbi:MAG: hypothetical protein RLZ55_590 [Actinomycetota bacterium]
MLAFALTFLGVLIGLSAVRERPQLRPMAVFAGDLPAGHVLAPADVRTLSVAAEAVPKGALSAAADANGQTLAGPVSAGEPVTAARVLGPGLLTGSPPGTVALPVRLDEAADSAFVRQGDVVDVVSAPRGAGIDSTAASTSSTARTVARAVRVLAVPGESGAGGTFLGGTGAGSPEGSVIIVAVDSATAATLAGLAGTTRLAVLLRGS